MPIPAPVPVQQIGFGLTASWLAIYTQTTSRWLWLPVQPHLTHWLEYRHEFSYCLHRVRSTCIIRIVLGILLLQAVGP